MGKRRTKIRMGRYRWAIRRVAPLLLMLLVAGCGGSTAGVNSTAHPTAAPAAEKQDIIPSSAVTPHAPTATAQADQTPPAGVPAAPSAHGRVILVSLSRQQLYAYENGTLAFTFLVETGRPALATPTGVYHIFFKNCSDRQWITNSTPTYLHNTKCPEHNGDGFPEMFTSPWPAGSPYWYAPTHINYAMKFRDGGFYLHDAWWHKTFGPGSNVPHKLPSGEWETGSHGCVGMPTANAGKLYEWAPLGTTVYVRWNA